MPLLKSDLLTVMQAVTEERLSETNVEFSDKSACCVIAASEGYPKSYDKGLELTIPAEIADKVYVAGAKIADGKLVTNGGRVLGCTAVADDLKTAVEEAYKLVDKVGFANKYYRHDIGQRALKALK